MVMYVATSTFIGSDGKPSRPTQIDWPAPPDDVGTPVLSGLFYPVFLI